MSRRRARRGNRSEDNGFEEWGGYMEAKKSKLTDQYNLTTLQQVQKVSDLFKGVGILVNGLTHPTADELKQLMAAHGGLFHLYQTSKTTHIIASNLPNVKINKLGSVPIVKPSWITDSISLGKLLDYRRYLLYTNQSTTQPRLDFAVFPDVTSPNIKIPILTETSTLSATTMLPEVVTIASSTVTTMPAASVVSATTTIMLQTTSTLSVSTTPLPTTSVLSAPIVTLSSSKSIEPYVSISTATSTKTASDPKFLEEFYNNSRLHLISTLGAEFKQLVGQLRDQSNGRFLGLEKLIDQNDSARSTEPQGVVVMHIDMDCFFVSVGLRNRPDLRGKPVAVTHARSAVVNTNRDKEIEIAMNTERLGQRMEIVDGTSSLSEIASCSYEARKSGVRNGMFLGTAAKLCPGIQTIPYDFEGYKQVSNVLYRTMASYTLNIEAVSCDEMYVDVTDVLRASGLTVEQWATHIRSEITAITGCPCSAGFGANRLQARLATKRAKPAGQFHLLPKEVETYMVDIPLADLPGVGHVTLGKLKNMGLVTCGDLQLTSLQALQAELGPKMGETLFDQARGIDRKPLNFYHERKSVSAEVNYGIRFKTLEECHDFLERLAGEVCTRLGEVKMRARCVTLKLMVRAMDAPLETAKYLGHGICDSLSKSSTTNGPISEAKSIFKEAKGLYEKLHVNFADLRGVGIQLTKLEKVTAMSKALSKFLQQKPLVKPKISEVPKELPGDTPGDTPEQFSENVLNNVSEEVLKEIPKGLLKEIMTEVPGTFSKQLDISNKKSINMSPVKNKPNRGRPKESTNNSSKASKSTSLLAKATKNDNTLSKFFPAKKDIPLSQTKLLSTSSFHIDLEILEELPEDMRNEIIKEYNLDITSKPVVPSTQKEAVSTPLVSQRPRKLISQNSSKKSPFSGLSWEQLKTALRDWMQAEEEPKQLDVEMLGKHFRYLAFQREIEMLKFGFNFLHRNLEKLGCKWHSAYFVLAKFAQEGMVIRYGRYLQINMTFSCCVNQIINSES